MLIPSKWPNLNASTKTRLPPPGGRGHIAAVCNESRVFLRRYDLLTSECFVSGAGSRESARTNGSRRCRSRHSEQIVMARWRQKGKEQRVIRPGQLGMPRKKLQLQLVARTRQPARVRALARWRSETVPARFLVENPEKRERSYRIPG